jgi:hypothetical protein
MAIIFELYAECLQKDKAAQWEKHFDELTFTLATGKTVSWRATQQNSGPEIYAVVVHSPDLSRFGVRSVQDVVESTEAGLRLYHHLKSCPVFEFARVGWEVETVTVLDLKEWVEPIGNAREVYYRLHCVVSSRLYEQLGRPKFFQEFVPGFMWNKYYGEEYRPLWSSDQDKLNAIGRGLFPEIFGGKQRRNASETK